MITSYDISYLCNDTDNHKDYSVKDDKAYYKGDLIFVNLHEKINLGFHGSEREITVLCMNKVKTIRLKGKVTI